MKLILLGPPGSGKGTQSNLLQSKFHIPKISTGDILRSAVEEHSELGEKAKVFMDQGELVTDEIVIGLIKARINESDCGKGFILDGFPRNMVQAEKLDEMLGDLDQELDWVVDLEVDPDELLVRLVGRSTCKNCGAMFHRTARPPKAPDICDGCGGELYQRPDDNEATIVKRLAVYEKETAPLKDFYSKQGKLKSLKGWGSVEEIFSRVCEMVT